jgi:hypothetical protein
MSSEDALHCALRYAVVGRDIMFGLHHLVRSIPVQNFIKQTHGQQPRARPRSEAVRLRIFWTNLKKSLCLTTSSFTAFTILDNVSFVTTVRDLYS